MTTKPTADELMRAGRGQRWSADTRARSAVKTLTMLLPKLDDRMRAEIAGELGPLTAAYHRR